MINLFRTKKSLLIFLLISLVSCSHIETTPTDVDRTISSISDDECERLLNKFLSNEEKGTYVVGKDSADTIVPKLMPKNRAKFISPEEMSSISKKAELEAADAFNSFSKEAKSMASSARFKMLVDPHEALMARVMMIRKAKKTIDLTYYIFQDSETSKILIAELREALRRGVNVRLMVDGSGSIAATTNFFKEIQVLTHTVGGKILDDAGNEIGRAKFEAIDINPMFNVRATIKDWYAKVKKIVNGKETKLDDFAIFHRSHDKILLVDASSPEDSMAIIGGRNISNHYYKIGTEEERDSTFNDLDILIKHVAYTETQDEKEVIRNVLLDHFNRLYYYSANKNFEDFIFKTSRGNAAKTLNEMRNTRNELVRTEGAELGELLEKMEKENFLNDGFDKGYVSFLDEIENLIRTNPLKNVTYETNQNSIIKNMWSQVEKAEKDIMICSPYVYLTDKEISFLADWLKADPSRTLRMITNSSATSDNLFAQSMVENFVMPKLLKAMEERKISPKQYEILAYGNLDNKEFGGSIPQGKLHAKFWMIDNYAMGVGTSNFDPISRWTNSEVVANVFPVEGKRSIGEINKYYKTLKDNSSTWNSPDFMQAKFRPELKKKLMIQSFIAKILKTFNILPQN